jgi:hypothetical protein
MGYELNVLNKFIASSQVFQEVSFRPVDSEEYVVDVSKVQVTTIVDLFVDISFEEEHATIGYHQI